MKKIAPYVVLIFFLFNTGGYYFWFRILQNRVQHEIEQKIINGLSVEDISIIIVPVNEDHSLSWIKPGKEFKYQGDRYDVIKSMTLNQQKHYYCIKDVKEKQLIAKYNKVHNSKKNAERRANRNLNQQYFVKQFSYTVSIVSSEYRFATFTSQYKSVYLFHSSPPPRS